MSSAADLVFIGGTGRSGTTVLAELLGRHSRFLDVPIECRFHCHPKGLADVVAGRATAEEFVRKLETYWWCRVRTRSSVIVPSGPVGRARLQAFRAARRLGMSRGHAEPRVRGLHLIIDRERFERAVAAFQERRRADLVLAARELFFDLLAPFRAAHRKPALVEMSTSTIAAAPELARIFPEARFVHTVRDGRDAGISKAALREKAHHPTDAISGIDFWAERLRRADRGVRGLSPDDRERLHLLSLDELVWAERERTYGELLEFVGIPDEPAMRDFFETGMTAEAAHRERWREGLNEPEQRRVTAHYDAILDGMEREGFHCAPLLRRTFELTLAAQPSG